MSYSMILTTLGAQRLAEAQASGVPLVFTEMVLGDGNGSTPTPDPDQTALVHEVWRGAVNNVDISPDAADIVRVEGLVESDDGGWTIREVGLLNGSDELIAVGNFPPTYKTQTSDGALTQEYVRVLIQYAAPTAIALTADPSVVTATRENVDDATAGGLYLWENFT